MKTGVMWRVSLRLLRRLWVWQLAPYLLASLDSLARIFCLEGP